jgi:hypothetical protein
MHYGLIPGSSVAIDLRDHQLTRDDLIRILQERATRS